MLLWFLLLLHPVHRRWWQPRHTLLHPTRLEQTRISSSFFRAYVVIAVHHFSQEQPVRRVAALVPVAGSRGVEESFQHLLV